MTGQKFKFNTDSNVWRTESKIWNVGPGQYTKRETERKRERVCYPNKSPAIAQKKKFSINDFFSKRDQIHSFLRHRFGHIYWRGP